MKITRRDLWAAGVMLAPRAERRTNLLVVIADDLNTDLGCYGEESVKTPAVDALAARGVRFGRAYCQYPLCNPSRSSFLSGRRPETLGLYDQQTVLRNSRPELVLLPDFLRSLGYFVGGAGKVFHHERPNAKGFDEFDLSASQSQEEIAASKRRYANPEDRRTPDWWEIQGEEAETADARLVKRAGGWIERAQSLGKPFALFCGLRKPHLPWAVPKKYFDLYPIPALGPAPEMRGIPEAALITELTPSPGPASRAEAVRAYRAATSYMDAQIGKLLGLLNGSPAAENTVVVFLGDNGFHLGDHGLWSKHTLFERATRVPLILAGPGIRRGGVCPRTVELLDLYPTLAECAGVRAPAGLQGKSLAPLLKRPEAGRDRAARTVTQRRGFTGRAVRTERWRYVEWNEGKDGVELYDHRIDPGETVNLAREAGQKGVIRDLKQRLAKA